MTRRRHKHVHMFNYKFWEKIRGYKPDRSLEVNHCKILTPDDDAWKEHEQLLRSGQRPRKNRLTDYARFQHELRFAYGADQKGIVGGKKSYKIKEM